MRAVVQRTDYSSVSINGELESEINEGLMVLLGIKKGDTLKDADYLLEKIINLRIFPDQEGKMNLSLQDIKGQLMLVSQFTLYGDARKGRRPSFIEAELPEAASPIFDYCINRLKEIDIPVETGVFGAEMHLTIKNYGPCTILLDSDKEF
ncbi:MAG: D-aminoacyl-tRNA deacylase [Syntrophomonadaceae bacterium]|nr:D-aminoacyl-tRNA deacylase [Syntrophomonadaceae bacterium]MDD3024654.1 D-aminoacyl-tRNA deacylase [Syntrophomonadaceae bacterium]